jgi:hypothetical protein
MDEKKIRNSQWPFVKNFVPLWLKKRLDNSNLEIIFVMYDIRNKILPSRMGMSRK